MHHNFIPDGDDSLTGMSQEIQVCDCGFKMLGVYPGVPLHQRMIAFTNHYAELTDARLTRLENNGQ